MVSTEYLELFLVPATLMQNCMLYSIECNVNICGSVIVPRKESESSFSIELKANIKDLHAA